MELLKRKESWNIGYEHALGETASWFFVQIRDHANRPMHVLDDREPVKELGEA